MHILADTVNDTAKQQNDPINTNNNLINDPIKVNILNWLKKNPKLNYNELAEKTGHSTSTIKRHIQKLKKMSLIERAGSNKTGFWKVNEK